MLPILLIYITGALSEKNACKHFYDYPFKAHSNNCYVNRNVMALTPTMILQNGYRLLSYNVTTSDGYTLQLFRIPPETVTRNNKTVFLDHGLFHDSSSWTFIGNRSLAFNLADRGYDVWIANDRGSRYSRPATNFEYWLYSLDTLAAYDIPAFLEKIGDVTGVPKSVVYVGHSRGTTLAFMYASEFPEHAQKFLRGIVALCPIVYFDAAGYVRGFMHIVPSLARVLLSLKISAVSYYQDLIFYVQYRLCSVLPYVCKIFLDVTSGVTWQFLADDLLAYVTHAPSTESVMLIMQYAQMAISGKFQKFDFGSQRNLETYGTEVPPQYNLRNVKVPVFMFYGRNDILIKRKAVRKIFRQLGSPRKKFWKIPVHEDAREYQFSHNDFIWAKYLETLLYPLLFDVIDNEI